MNGKNIRKAALSIALGACLGSMAPMTMAQSVTGAVAGRANVGETITVTNTATGASRTVTVGSDGTYRVAQLPPGNYTLKAGSGEPIAVNVSLGGTTAVNLDSSGAVNLDTVSVVGSRVVNRVDVRSTETSTNISREEWSRLPVDQNLASVALLAPGVIATGATFGGLSFGGSSVAENVVYINGMDVTDPYRRQGYSSVPFAFYQEFQVKTGGYSAEFGRSTGGVINAVTRSGSNEFKGGVEVTLEPSAWQSAAKDRYHEDGTLHNVYSRDSSSWFKTNVWASGPIVKDRLFFFAMYEDRESNSEGYGTSSASKSEGDNGFWGGKLDWAITDNHKLELLAFSDEAESNTTPYEYDWDTDTLGRQGGTGTSGSGGDNWSLTYTGHFTDNLMAKVLYGVNKRSAVSSTPLDGDCSIVGRPPSTYFSLFPQALTPGCHPTNGSVNSRLDEREVARLDFEWQLGSHLLRFGYDKEVMDSNSSVVYPGDGSSYIVNMLGVGSSLPDGTVVPAGPYVATDADGNPITAVVDARHYVTGAPVSTDTQAFYLEDNWSVTPNLLLNLGLRFDKFTNTLASGAVFAKTDFSDMISPRLGFSWDVKGDGSMKLFGNAGRYYLPITNKLTDYFGGGTIDEHTYYTLMGWEEQNHPSGGTYLSPVLGAQLGSVNTTGNVPAPTDMRTAVARDLKQVFQDEYILGFQQAINQAWSWGVNATYREVTRAVEDVRITHVEGCPWYSGDWPILNPGETNTLWCPTTEEWVTFDSSKDGYVGVGSGVIIGYPKPKRTYKAVEFQIDRAWDDKWFFNASYIWSKSEGNVEGPVNSDTGYADTNLVQYFDHPAVNERYGVLFNDHEHQIKLRGGFKLNDMWSFGATASAISGGPITAFGVRWPVDNRSAGGPGEYSGGGSGWICTANCNPFNYATSTLEYTGRGAFGRMPWVYNLGANVTWTLPVEDIDLKARFSVYNLLNKQEVVNVHSRYESTPGTQMPYFGEGTVWQSPRYMNLVVTWNF